MINIIPDENDMIALIGQSLYDVWQRLCAAIDEKYDMDRIWNSGGKSWTYEYKYRRGGKTLCALYARENCMGFMVILGKDERAKFEAIGILFLMLFVSSMMRRKPIMTGNGLCLNRLIRLILMTT